MQYILSVIDWIIIFTFIIAVFLVGLIDRRKVSLEDYWVNGRKTSKWVLIATLFSTFVGAGAILGNASISFSGGGLLFLVIPASFFLYFYLFGHFFAHKIKEFGDKHKAYSLPDWFEHRYSRKVKVSSAIVNFITFCLFLAVQILAIGALIETLSGFNATTANIIGGLIVIAYTSIGGLRADIRTDVFQTIIMIFLLTILLPLTIIKGGGINALSQLPSSFLLGKEFAPFYVYFLAFLFVGASTLSSADIWQRAYAADSSKNAKNSIKIASVFVFLFIAMGTLLGIYAKIMIPNSDPNNIIPELMVNILPAGFLGLVVAGLIAAVMSSADTMLLITSMTVMHDFHYSNKKIRPSEKEILHKTRIATLLIGIIGLVVAILVDSIAHLAITSITFSVVLLPSIIFGFYWKRANSRAAFWSIILGLIATITFIFIDPVQAFIPGTIVSFIAFWLVAVLSIDKK